MYLFVGWLLFFVCLVCFCCCFVGCCFWRFFIVYFCVCLRHFVLLDLFVCWLLFFVCLGLFYFYFVGCCFGRFFFFFFFFVCVLVVGCCWVVVFLRFFLFGFFCCCWRLGVFVCGPFFSLFFNAFLCPVPYLFFLFFYIAYVVFLRHLNFQSSNRFKISNFIICFCSFDLSCSILEKDTFIENLYIVLSCLIK